MQRNTMASVVLFTELKFLESNPDDVCSCANHFRPAFLFHRKLGPLTLFRPLPTTWGWGFTGLRVKA